MTSTDTVFLYLAITGIALLLTVAIQSLGNIVRVSQGMRVGEFIDRQIHERAINVDLAFYESSRYFDSLRLTFFRHTRILRMGTGVTIEMTPTGRCRLDDWVIDTVATVTVYAHGLNSANSR